MVFFYCFFFILNSFSYSSCMFLLKSLTLGYFFENITSCALEILIIAFKSFKSLKCNISCHFYKINFSSFKKDVLLGRILLVKSILDFFQIFELSFRGAPGQGKGPPKVSRTSKIWNFSFCDNGHILVLKKIMRWKHYQN